jgi:putative ABC transport system permease protein
MVTLCAGAYPAIALSRVRPMSALATGHSQIGSPLLSTILVATEFAAASFLLITVTVMSSQNAAMRQTALSAIQDPLVVIENPAAQTKVAAATLRERLTALPEVRGVTEMRTTPWEMLMMTNVAQSPDPSSAQRPAFVRQVGYDFFDVFNVPLLAGRVFDRSHAEDLRLPPKAAQSGTSGGSVGEPQVEGPVLNVIVERQFVEALGLGTPSDAIGARIYQPAPPIAGAPRQPPMQIIRVVENRSFSFWKMPTASVGAIYTLLPNQDFTVARIAARDIDRALRGIDSAWRDLAPNVAISRRFLDEIFERAYSQYVRVNQLFITLSVIAFAICVSGLFSMAFFVAGRRRREIGVRKTLGGTTGRMVALLLAGFSRPVLIANLVAWPAGYLAARAYLRQFSQSIELSLWPFLSAAVITLVIACLAVLSQTLRAARTTPAEVLRNE